MSALTQDRSTVENADGKFRTHPLAAAVKAIAGGIAVLDASGNVKPGVTATGLIACGRFEETVDNSAGSAGDLDAKVKEGDFWFGNSAAGDAITRAEIGDDCYIVDDQTVAKTDGTATRSVAGKIIDVDAVKGVCVRLAL